MKKTLLSLLAAISVTAAFSQNLDSGLVGYFPFNGNVNNKGSGSNGANYGASITSDRFNNPNSAYSFNGSSSYIDLTSPYDLPERSISFWFYATAIESTAKMIYSSDFANIVNGCTVVNLINSSGTDKVTFAVGYQRAEAPITKNEWHHILITRTTNTTQIFLDCFEISQTTSNLANSVNGLSKTIIGSSRNLSTYFFAGKIDDIRIYNRAVSPQEAKILCSEQNPCTNIIAMQPQNYKAKGGGNAGFWTYSNLNPSNYQWQINEGKGFTNIPGTCNYSGVNSSALSVDIVGIGMDKNSFRCIIANDQCSDTTSIASLEVDSVGKGSIHDTIYLAKDTVYLKVIDTVYVNKTDTLYKNTSDTLFIQFKLGINVLDQLTIKMFPNPTKDHLTIDFGTFQNFNNYTLNIVNEQSQQVYNSLISQQTVNIDLSAWTGAGVYFVTLKDNNGISLVTKKIVLK
ncbi:MAG: T9SS type A sorting domain-containing protein [Bacteroidetes bacterium]|nr:T9SS type A sorting domain-containing protein [Bacteroidota bacterium]